MNECFGVFLKNMRTVKIESHTPVNVIWNLVKAFNHLLWHAPKGSWDI